MGTLEFIFGLIFIILAGYKYNHKSLDEFEFWPTPPLITELAAHGCLKIDVESCDYSRAFCFD